MDQCISLERFCIYLKLYTKYGKKVYILYKDVIFTENRQRSFIVNYQLFIGVVNIHIRFDISLQIMIKEFIR